MSGPSAVRVLPRSGFFTGHGPSPGQGPFPIRALPPSGSFAGKGPSQVRVLPSQGGLKSYSPITKCIQNSNLKPCVSGPFPVRVLHRSASFLRSGSFPGQGLPRSGSFPGQGPSPARVLHRSGSAPGQGEPKFYPPITKCIPNSILKLCVSGPSLVRVVRK